MGLREAILDDVKKQGIEIGEEQGIEKGIEIGEAKRDEELLNNAVPELMQEGFSAERIAAILNLPLESVQAAVERAAQDSNNTPANQPGLTRLLRFFSRLLPVCTSFDTAACALPLR